MDSDYFGWKAFAGIMILVAGTFNVIDGLIGLSNVRYFTDVTPGVGTAEYPIVNDVKVWSWVILAAGVLMMAASFAIFSGQMWGRVVGIAAAAINMVIQFTYLAHYPFWSLAILALDGFVIFALTARGAPARTPYSETAGQVNLDLSQPMGEPSPTPAPGMAPQQPATH
jgi:hypothetical protein